MKIENLTAVSLTLLLSTTMMTSVSAHDGKYVSDSSGNPVRDSSGKCVRAATGNVLEGCGAPVAVEEAAPIVTPMPIVRAPAPRVHVLNLNESGGSNFATNSAELSSNARHQLTGFASKVKASGVSPSNITIVGHTDSLGSDSYNQNLSVNRAQSVAAFLESQGMNPDAMHVSGKGESQPVASNETKAGRAANRRVEITVSGQRRMMGK